jgi:hypothetical protein
LEKAAFNGFVASPAYGRSDERVEAEAAKQTRRTAADRRALDEFAPCMTHEIPPKNVALPPLVDIAVGTELYAEVGDGMKG